MPALAVIAILLGVLLVVAIAAIGVLAKQLAQAQVQVQQSLKSVNIMDPTSEVGRFEDKIRREEAKVRGQQELAASSLDSQFESLDDAADDLEVDSRLAALKSGG